LFIAPAATVVIKQNYGADFPFRIDFTHGGLAGLLADAFELLKSSFSVF
jgi:hypothetical protein